VNLTALHTLIAAGESLTLELKKSTAEKDRACRTLCAFANGQGGYLVFGVTPSGMQEAGLAAPTLKVNADFVTMTFFLPSSADKTPVKTGVIGSEKSSEKSSEKILHHLRSEPTLSAKALAEKLGVSSRAVEKQIDLLKKEGRLRRIGPAKGGHWQVLE